MGSRVLFFVSSVILPMGVAAFYKRSTFDPAMQYAPLVCLAAICGAGFLVSTLCTTADGKPELSDSSALMVFVLVAFVSFASGILLVINRAVGVGVFLLFAAIYVISRPSRWHST